MECNFFVGQKVVCIRDVWNSTEPNKPIKGSVYTVREIITSAYGDIGIRLREIHNPAKPWIEGIAESAWYYAAFRPTTEGRVEELRKLLKRPTPLIRDPVRDTTKCS